jgi:hypothetical protein
MYSRLRLARIRIGDETFAARLQTDLAPRSCEYLLSLLPYQGSVIHARWSGEAMWCPLGEVVPGDLVLPQESPSRNPEPGEILLFIDEKSEPELLFPYGKSRFASVAGALEGNPVLLITERLDALSKLGHEALWHGAMPLRIEL